MALGSTAEAQLRVLGSERVFSVGQLANVFVEFDDARRLVGMEVGVPEGWELQGVDLIHRGRNRPVSWRRDVEGPIQIVCADPVAGRQLVALRVKAPSFESTGMLRTAAFVTDPSAPDDVVPVPGSRESLVVEPLLVDEDNKVASFTLRERLELRSELLPMFAGDRSYTLEFWFRTTMLDQVLVSSWNGNEDEPYPVEMVISTDGRLLFFRGEAGRHVAMASKSPVADGHWHHAAVTHDEVRGWSRLVIDAQPADSLFGSAGADYGSRPRFCVGGRCPSEDAPPHRGYAGLIDDVRLWAMSRSNRQIASTMAEQLPDVPGLVSLDFERSTPRQLLAGRDEIPRATSEVLFVDPVSEVRAIRGDEGVEVSWSSRARSTRTFVLERSTDGQNFVAIGEADSKSSNAGRFVLVDVYPPDAVAYYRVRQNLKNDGTRLSATIKVGLGTGEQPEALGTLLIGNFPNPFRATTTIVFEVMIPQHVTVSVWDVSGQRVSLLSEGFHSTGLHEVQFVPGDLPSGTYFVRLQTDGFITARKMILTR